MCSLLLLLLLPSIMFPCQGRALRGSKDAVNLRSLEGKLGDGMQDRFNDANQVKQEYSISGVERVVVKCCNFGLPQAYYVEVRSIQPATRTLLGIETKQELPRLKETRTVAELVAMDYPRARRGPSIHNR